MFKVGDIVRVKPKEFFLDKPRYHSNSIDIECGFIDDMYENCNKLFVVSNNWFTPFGSFNCYELKKDVNDTYPISYTWNDWMLEKANKQLDLFEE